MRVFVLNLIIKLVNKLSCFKMTNAMHKLYNLFVIYNKYVEKSANAFQVSLDRIWPLRPYISRHATTSLLQ